MSTDVISTDAMAAWWGQAPDGRTTSDHQLIDAAIWSGSPREIFAEPDTGTHVLAMPLRRYECAPFVDGKPVQNALWDRGAFQTMLAGVTPRAVLSSDWRMLHVYMPDALVRTVADDLGIRRDVELIDQQGQGDPELERLMCGVEAELTRGSRPAKLLIDSYAIQLTATLLRNWSNAADRLKANGALSVSASCDWRIRRSLEEIEARIHEDLGLIELAAAVGLSPSHYATLFRAATGLPPHAWVVKRRIERAQELLLNPHASITDIAFALGFPSSQHFATMFKKHTGVTPSEWRRHLL